jgi:DNA replication protein DnaC
VVKNKNMENEIKSHYSYSEVINWLEAKGVELYGKKFKILETDHEIIYKLIAYFLKDEQACYQFNIDLEKGILLTGPIGCGKTSLINLMKYLTATEHKFFIKPSRDISFEFIQDGYQIIHKYSIGKLYQSEPRTYCFDDLGTENNLKYFGNECNVMAEILLSRYDLFISKKLQTHITTNLSATEIEKQYGNRVRSRLRELCNLIAFENVAKDKRK